MEKHQKGRVTKKHNLKKEIEANISKLTEIMELHGQQKSMMKTLDEAGTIEEYSFS